MGRHGPPADYEGLGTVLGLIAAVYGAMILFVLVAANQGWMVTPK